MYLQPLTVAETLDMFKEMILILLTYVGGLTVIVLIFAVTALLAMGTFAGMACLVKKLDGKKKKRRKKRDKRGG